MSTGMRTECHGIQYTICIENLVICHIYYIIDIIYTKMYTMANNYIHI